VKARSVILFSLVVILVTFTHFFALAALTIRILPLGDSITYGSDVPGGYRLPLYQLLTNAGFNVDFLGTQTNNSAPALPDPNHEGHIGWRIDQIDSSILGVFGQIADPDIILLLIGTNDYRQGYDTAHATNRLEALIVKMATNRPFARIVVANLTHRNEPYNTQIQQTFNPFVPGIVARQAALGRQVYFTDMYSAIPPSDFADVVHPNAVGYAKMATNWFTAITNRFDPNGRLQVPEMKGATIAGGTVQVFFAGLGGYQYQVLRSTNLVNWGALSTITMPPPGTYIITDTNPPSEQAYYRAALLQ